jgi:hypothetical protein
LNIGPFGNVDKDNLEDYYDGTLEIDGQEIEVDLNFESDSVDDSLFKEVEKTINNIESLSEKAWVAISNDWDLDAESETVRFYLEHHLEHFDEDEIIDIFGSKDVDKEAFFNAISLTRVSLYPEDDEMYVVFDVQLSPEITNYLISVAIDRQGQVADITFES